jgi:hypothetical protein
LHPSVRLGGSVLGQEYRSTAWAGRGFDIRASFRIELREFYVHDAAWVEPGGAPGRRSRSPELLRAD